MEKRSHLFYLGLVGLASYGINVFLNIIISAKLSQAGYGLYALAKQSFALVSGILLLGTEVAASSFLTDFLALDDRDRVQLFVSWNVRIAKRSCLLLLVVFGVLILLDIFTRLDSSEQFHKIHIVIAYLAFTPFGSLKQLFTSYLLSINYIKVYTVVTNLSEVTLTILLFEGFYLLAGKYPNDEGLLLLTLAVNLVIILAEYWVLGHEKGETVNFRSMIKKAIVNRSPQQITVPKQWFSSSAVLTMTNLTYLLVGSIDMYIARMFCGSHGLATYAVALALSIIVTTVADNFHNTLIPFIRHQYSPKEHQTIQKKINTTQLMAVVTLSIILLLLGLTGSYTLSQFGNGYNSSSGIWTLNLMASAHAVEALGAPALYMMLYGGYERHALVCDLVELGLLVIFCILFSIKLGIVGIALGLVVSRLGFLLISVLLCRRLTCLKPLGFV